MGDVDWDIPIRDAWTHQQVWVTGKTVDGYVIVRDAKGRRLPFNISGAPVGHQKKIENIGDAILFARLRLVDLIVERTAQLVEQQEIAEYLTMENIEAWGSF